MAHQDNAGAFENLSLQARTDGRQADARRRDLWPKDTEIQRAIRAIAGVLAQAKEEAEETVMLLKPAAAVVEGKAARLAGARRVAQQAGDQLKRLEVAVRHGFAVMESVFGEGEEVPGLSAEEEKRLKSLLANKGKKRKREEELDSDYDVQTVQGAYNANRQGNQLLFGYGWNVPPSVVFHLPRKATSSVVAPASIVLPTPRHSKDLPF